MDKVGRQEGQVVSQGELAGFSCKHDGKHLEFISRGTTWLVFSKFPLLTA